MHLFDTTDPGVVAARPKFLTTMFLLALGTYLVAGVAYWHARNSEEDSTDSSAQKEVTGPINSENLGNGIPSKTPSNSDGKEASQATSSTSQIPTDAAKSS
jgi:hypothetical protein